jgi:hypothetical protein
MKIIRRSYLHNLTTKFLLSIATLAMMSFSLLLSLVILIVLAGYFVIDYLNVILIKKDELEIKPFSILAVNIDYVKKNTIKDIDKMDVSLLDRALSKSNVLISTLEDGRWNENNDIYVESIKNKDFDILRNETINKTKGEKDVWEII